MSKGTTFAELRRVLAARVEGVGGDGEGGGGGDGGDGDGDETVAARVRVVKPWAWQLKDASNIAGLRWDERKPDGSTLGGKLWKLRDGDVLVFRVAADGEDDTDGARARAAGARPAPRAAAHREGGGFRILSPEERAARAREAEDETQKTRRIVEERLAVLQHKWRTKPGAAALPLPPPAPPEARQ